MTDMTEFEQKLVDALNNIAKATEHVSTSIDDLASVGGVDTDVIATAIDKLGDSIRGRIK